jgi:hypothetical protein
LAVPVGTLIHQAPVRVGRMCSLPMRQAPDTVSGVHMAVARPGSDRMRGHFLDTAPCLCFFFVRPAPERSLHISPSARAVPRSAAASPRTGAESGDSPPAGASSSARVRRPALVVKPHDGTILELEIRHDEADAREQFAAVALDFRHDSDARSLKRDLQKPVERELKGLGFFLTHRVSPIRAGFLVRTPRTSRRDD